MVTHYNVHPICRRLHLPDTVHIPREPLSVDSDAAYPVRGDAARLCFRLHLPTSETTCHQEQTHRSHSSGIHHVYVYVYVRRV